MNFITPTGLRQKAAGMNPNLNMIMQEFTAEEINDIYPALNEEMLLLEELELMDYIQVRNGKIFVTDAGRGKLNEFKATLSHEEKDALRM